MRGPGPNRPSELRSSLLIPGIPAPVSTTVFPYPSSDLLAFLPVPRPPLRRPAPVLFRLLFRHQRPSDARHPVGQLGLAAGEMLSRNESEPRGKVAPPTEASHRRREGLDRRHADRPGPRDAHQTPRLLLIAGAGAELPLQLQDLHFETGNLGGQNTVQFADRLRQPRALICNGRR